MVTCVKLESETNLLRTQISRLLDPKWMVHRSISSLSPHYFLPPTHHLLHEWSRPGSRLDASTYTTKRSSQANKRGEQPWQAGATGCGAAPGWHLATSVNTRCHRTLRGYE